MNSAPIGPAYQRAGALGGGALLGVEPRQRLGRQPLERVQVRREIAPAAERFEDSILSPLRPLGLQDRLAHVHGRRITDRPRRAAGRPIPRRRSS